MIRILKNIKKDIGLIILLFVLFLYYFYSFYDMLFDFLGLSFRFFLAILGLTTIIFTVVSFVYMNKTDKKRLKKIYRFLLENSHRITLFYAVSIFIFSNIKSEVSKSIDDLKYIISLEWGIIGISITIFLVWNVLILQYLKKKMPQFRKDFSLWEEFNYIEDKETSYRSINTTFVSVVLLTINLAILIFSTATVILSDGVNLINQNATFVSFCFCTNSVFLLFIDMLKPLYDEKKSLLEKNKITNKDFERKEKIRDEMYEMYDEINSILSSDNLNENEKIIRCDEIMHKLYGTPFSIREHNDNLECKVAKNEVTPNDQL